LYLPGICCTHVLDTLSVTVCDVGLIMDGAVNTIVHVSLHIKVNIARQIHKQTQQE